MRSLTHLFRTALLVALAGALLALCLSAAAAGSAQGATFVSRQGAQLTLGGQPYRFIADNNYQATSLPGGYDCGRAESTATLDQVLQAAAASGATVIRTWFFQSYYDLNSQGKATSPSYAAFDRVLSEAGRYGLKVIPVLVNEWQDCEPPSVNKNIGFYQSGYQKPGFGYPLSFQQYASTVAGHYASNPNIAFWQIGNELESNTPSGCTAAAESQGAHALRSFADTMTQAIKSADPNHLVSLGTIGSGQCGLEGSDYQYVMSGSVDLCEYHDYNAPTQPMPGDSTNGLAARIQQCAAINKPLFVGESGIPADVNDQGGQTGSITASSLQLRSGFFQAKMQAAFNAGVVGYGLWDKEEDASASSWNAQSDQYYEVGSGDPTNTMTAQMAANLNAGAGTVISNFDDGSTDGWTAPQNATGLSLSTSGSEAYDGSQSLALNLSSGATNTSVSTTQVGGANPGTTLTMHVYEPTTAPAGLTAAPFVTDSDGDVTGAVSTALNPGWNTIIWTIPNSVNAPLGSIGISVGGASDYAGALYLDAVSYGAAPNAASQANVALASSSAAAPAADAADAAAPSARRGVHHVHQVRRVRRVRSSLRHRHGR